MDVISLGPEEFEYKQVSVPLEECCLIYQWTTAALRTHSRVHENFESCWILGPQARGSIDGTELHPYSMIAAGPGSQGEVIADSNYENVGWLVPTHVLDQHLALRGKKRDFLIPEVPEVWHPAAKEAQDLFELGARIAAAAENTPEIFNDGHWARYGAQVEFMDSLLATIESCNPDETVDKEWCHDRYRRGPELGILALRRFFTGLQKLLRRNAVQHSQADFQRWCGISIAQHRPGH